MEKVAGIVEEVKNLTGKKELIIMPLALTIIDY